MRGVFLQTYKENTANQKEIHYSHVDNILCNQTTIMIQKQKFYRKYWICLPYTLDQLVPLDSTYGCTYHIDHLAQLYQYTLVQGMLLLQVCPPKIFDKYHNKAAKQKKNIVLRIPHTYEAEQTSLPQYKLYLLHGIFCEPIVFHQFMENSLAYFCLLRRGRSSKLVKFYVKPLVNLVMDSMVPAFFNKERFL